MKMQKVNGQYAVQYPDGTIFRTLSLSTALRVVFGLGI